MTKDSLSFELDQLLSESVTSARQRSGTRLDQSAGANGNRFVLFGAGQLGCKTMQGLRSVGIEPLAFVDNNSARWGTEIEGVKVLSPAEAAALHGRSASFVVTIWGGQGTDVMADRIRPLRELGCEKVITFGELFWKYPQIFVPHYAFDLPHKVLEQAGDVRRAFELFTDPASRAEFVAQVRWRLHLDFDGLPRPVQHEIYFPDDLARLSKHEVFVDCGAFDGDTMEAFLRVSGGEFDRFIAVEADPANFEKMRHKIEALPPALREKIITYPMAVGARREKVRFSASGTASSAVGNGSLEVDCVPLDELIAGERPTWIKMDIEGSEPDALAGGRKIISACSPALAICVYHSQDHLWKIPLQIHEMSPNYRFFLRPHVFECWDLVCYAIPVERLNF